MSNLKRRNILKDVNGDFIIDPIEIIGTFLLFLMSAVVLFAVAKSLIIWTFALWAIYILLRIFDGGGRQTS